MTIVWYPVPFAKPVGKWKNRPKAIQVDEKCLLIVLLIKQDK